MPPCEALHFVGYLYELGPTSGEGPITHAEIAAWQANTGVVLDGDEARLLRSLSAAYLSAAHQAKDASSPPPWADAPDVKPAVNQVAAQMQAAMRELRDL